jgi:hypothetical protein
MQCPPATTVWTRVSTCYQGGSAGAIAEVDQLVSQLLDASR